VERSDYGIAANGDGKNHASAGLEESKHFIHGAEIAIRLCRFEIVSAGKADMLDGGAVED